MNEKLKQACELVRQAQRELLDVVSADRGASDTRRSMYAVADHKLYEADKLLTGLLGAVDPTIPRPNARLLALRDINEGGLRYNKGEEFEAHIRFNLGGLLTCVLSNGVEVLLHDERLIDANARVIAELED